MLRRNPLLALIIRLTIVGLLFVLPPAQPMKIRLAFAPEVNTRLSPDFSVYLPLVSTTSQSRAYNLCLFHSASYSKTRPCTVWNRAVMAYDTQS